MHKFKLLFVGIITALFVGIAIIPSTNVQANSAVPKYLQGHFRRYTGRRVSIYPHHFYYAGNGSYITKITRRGAWYDLTLKTTQPVSIKPVKNGVEVAYEGGIYRTYEIFRRTKPARKTKSFHGYRVATLKYANSSNTGYDPKAHATLSSYRPTQKSKVIFDTYSHVYPTKHRWDYFPKHGKPVVYQYRYGSWHKTHKSV